MNTVEVVRVLVLVLLTTTACAQNGGGNLPTYNEPFRPRFHFSPPANWINDPNGLVYLDGEYHLFYQHNPLGDRWGHMSWGHSVSPDLLRWKHLPVAIPELETSGTMIFSGSAVFDADNTSKLGSAGNPPLVAIYTAHRQGNQSQALAFSTDRGRTWTQYAGNPVLDISKADFRDPKVFWHAPSRNWVMVVALPVEHQIAFYASPNLKEWNRLGTFGPAGDKENIWECPDLFELPVDGNPNATRWVLMASVGKAMQYFVGQFDGRAFVNDNPADQVLRPDFGPDYFAAVTFNNTQADTGRVSIGWMSNWSYAADLPTSPWRGAMAFPRQLSLRSTANGIRLVQSPFTGLEKLRKEHVRLTDQVVTSTSALALRGRCLELSLIADVRKDSHFGIRVAKGPSHETVIGYDATSSSLYLDRSRSGRCDFSKEFARRYSAPRSLKDGRLDLHVLVDSSSVEVFSGDVAITALIFPPSDSNAVELFAEKGSASIRSLDGWKIDSVWNRLAPQ